MEKENSNYIIYKAVNFQSGGVYIGATGKSLEERMQDHIQKSNKGLGGYFQEAIGTYGPEAFTWEQIDTANDVNEMASKEKKYILKYKSNKDGYNSDCGGGVQKNVYQYSVDEGRLVGTYDSLEHAAKAVNSSRKSISNACLGYNKSCRGFYWSYDCSEPFIPEMDKRKKEVYQISLQNQFVAKYVSVSEASKQTGISKTCISRCCRGERDRSGGYIWKYI
ncbi:MULTISPECIES: NUMOD1 domain-containing DNA-binding protein [unclassified Arenibacter]|uniref:NUMOD1 domain-containing DNA-binding protein n=1 Tax=unclassified Arenibacter TaxID=2615047 RepID=UPI000E355145|nr:MULTISPECIES: NUMOD1 domain-containing DNA-binding protein [unclassified Arenibacter]MCM4162157.1 endonuclease [Arenibacter sp. A80]RFT58337.1 endonuclease [Arenibacter sp. P308M17]